MPRIEACALRILLDKVSDDQYQRFDLFLILHELQRLEKTIVRLIVEEQRNDAATEAPGTAPEPAIGR